MIKEILNYIQGLLVLFLSIKVLLYLVPRSVFEKYISFFSGVILAIGVLRPLIFFFDWDELWHKTLYATTFEKQALEASINVDKMDSSKDDFYNQQMKVLVEKEMESQLQNSGIEIKEVEVELSEDYQVDNVRVVVIGENVEGNLRLSEYLEKEYYLSATQYQIVYE